MYHTAHNIIRSTQNMYRVKEHQLHKNHLYLQKTLSGGFSKSLGRANSSPYLSADPPPATAAGQWGAFETAGIYLSVFVVSFNNFSVMEVNIVECTISLLKVAWLAIIHLYGMSAEKVCLVLL